MLKKCLPVSPVHPVKQPLFKKENYQFFSKERVKHDGIVLLASFFFVLFCSVFVSFFLGFVFFLSRGLYLVEETCSVGTIHLLRVSSIHRSGGVAESHMMKISPRML